MAITTTTTTTDYHHHTYSLWPSTAYTTSSPPLPDHCQLVPIEFRFQEFLGCFSTQQIVHEEAPTKAFMEAPLGDLSDISLVAMTRSLSAIGIPDQLHSFIIADACNFLDSIVTEARAATTPPLVVVHVCAFTWMQVPDDDLEESDDAVLPTTATISSLTDD